MKETIAKIMRSGGYAVILATVAMALYLLVLEMGNKFIESQSVKLAVTIDENGYMSTNYGGDKKGVYVLWQTDGGCIKPVNKNEDLNAQYEEGNKWYFAYTGPNEKVKWEKEDADGFNYSEATIRATVYYTKEEKGPFYVYEFVNEASVTVKKENSKTVKTTDRLFSNPVREGEDKEWSQIYQVSKDTANTKTYMFRTGSEIKNPEKMILMWEANEEILSETDLIQGTVGSLLTVSGFMINPENSGKNIIAATPSVTINEINATDKFKMDAYLTYTSNSEKKAGEIPESEKFYKSDIDIAD